MNTFWSGTVSHRRQLSERGGTPMTLVLVDSATNTIRYIRLIGLGNKFSRVMAQDIDALRNEPFDAMIISKSVKEGAATHGTETA